MAKTNGLAKPRSISKRGQRRDIYSDENGNVFGDSKGSERNFSAVSESSNNSDLAAIQTMRYYFDSDWFDNENKQTFHHAYKRRESFIELNRSRGSAITPQRCVECRRPFQRIIPTPHKGKFAYINTEVFANMPLEDGVCGNCE
tara:strand:- start:218 stop:649 length:432 start_codon:yes stop_codon:yes gene_type:complete